VPLYMALLLDVMGARHEDPLASMRRMFSDYFFGGAHSDEIGADGLIRMDDRELSEEVQSALAERFAAHNPGDEFDLALYQRFMAGYARTRGFEVEGVDYEAEFDTDEVCR
ncbi:MAG: hypothetical protein KC457_20865, partial [Myxococcales bacterium]|nr:hypothetical protein [Myxococcales bacterium]